MRLMFKQAQLLAKFYLPGEVEVSAKSSDVFDSASSKLQEFC